MNPSLPPEDCLFTERHGLHLYHLYHVALCLKTEHLEGLRLEQTFEGLPEIIMVILSRPCRSRNHDYRKG